MIFLVLFTTVFQVNRILGGHTTRRQGSWPHGSHTTLRCPDPGLAVRLNSVLTPRKQSFEQKTWLDVPFLQNEVKLLLLVFMGYQDPSFKFNFHQSLPSRQSKETIIFYTHPVFFTFPSLFSRCAFHFKYSYSSLPSKLISNTISYTHTHVSLNYFYVWWLIFYVSLSRPWYSVLLGQRAVKILLQKNF